MNFEQLKHVSSFLAKDYSEDILRLLVLYPTISASEAATRLDMHIKTAQDALECLAGADVVIKEEVFEKKRPYFRYSLKEKLLSFNIDLGKLVKGSGGVYLLEKKIREKTGTGSVFTSSSVPQMLSSVSIFKGTGRQKKERKVSLTANQGKFLFFLPFPTASPVSVKEIMEKAGTKENYYNEVFDIIELLEKNGIIEMQ